MSNYKALGIGKEMEEVFNRHNKSDLVLLEESEYFNHPYIQRRKEGESYCNVSIVSCSGKDWWYKNLIGWTFFCRIYFNTLPNGMKYVTDYKGVKLTKNKEILFRGFAPEDVVMI